MVVEQFMTQAVTISQRKLPLPLAINKNAVLPVLARWFVTGQYKKKSSRIASLNTLFANISN